ncbi:hypothetical protein Tco_1194853 [Tanacetum coccineum]
MLAEAQEARQILDEEQHAFLAYPGVSDGQAVQTIIPNTAAFQTGDLDTYDSDCDDIWNAQAVLMANISNYGSNVISEVPHSATYLTDMENQSVNVMQDFEQTPAVNFSDNEIHMISNYHSLSEDSGKRFTPQQEIDVEQAFWWCISNLISKPSNASPIKIEAPKELLKNDLKAQLQDKDSTICKLKDIIKSLREKSKDKNVKYDYCEIETKNVELKNSVAKLLSENERLCNEINHVKQEQADILWGIVEQAKEKQPLDKELDFAFEYDVSTSTGYGSSSLSNTAYSSQQINTAYPLPLDTAMTKVIKGEFEKIKDIKVEDDSLTCDSPLEVFNCEVSQLSKMDDDLFTYEVEIANIPCDLRVDDDSEHEADDIGFDSSDFAFTEWLGSSFVDPDLLTKDIMRFKTYDDYKDDWIYEWNKDVPWVDEKPWTDTGMNDGYCNGGNLPGTFIIENQLHYQDYEWYEALEDSELKDEALRNKAIMEGFIKDDDDESNYEQMRRWDIYTNYDDTYKTNHDDNEREELCEVHEPPVCTIQRFEMIKYSFGQSEEYVSLNKKNITMI